MKRIAFLLLFVCSAFGEPTRLPEEFTVIERFLSLTATFDINTEIERIGIARKRIFSLTTAFDLEDGQEKPIASAKARLLAWGTVADVLDRDGNRIGWIEEELFRIIPWAEFRVFNSENTLLAIAKMNFWGTKFEITPPDRPEEVYATVSRPFIRFFRDYWTVRIRNMPIFEEKVIDPRMLMMLAVFQTDRDNLDRIKNEIQDQLRLEFEDFEGRRLGLYYEPVLSPLLEELEGWAATLQTSPYDTWEELEHDLELAAPFFPTGNSDSEYFSSTLKNGLEIIRNPDNSNKDRILLIRVLKEFVSQYEIDN